jgi:hypothetical protein
VLFKGGAPVAQISFAYTESEWWSKETHQVGEYSDRFNAHLGRKEPKPQAFIARGGEQSLHQDASHTQNSGVAFFSDIRPQIKYQ